MHDLAGFLFQNGHPVMQCPQGADPPAKNTAEKKCNHNQDKGKVKGYRDVAGGKKIGDEDKGIEIQEYPHGIAEFVGPFGLRLDEKKEKKHKKDSLRNPAEAAR